MSLLFFILRNTILNNNATANSISLFACRPSPIALNGVNCAIFNLFTDAHMVGRSITLSIKENNIIFLWCISYILPLSTLLNQQNNLTLTSGEFYDNAFINIPTIIGTPQNKANTPWGTSVKAVPYTILPFLYSSGLSIQSYFNLSILLKY